MPTVVKFENNSLFSKKTLEISDECIEYKRVRLNVSDVVAMHYGTLVHYHNGIKASTDNTIVISDGERTIKASFEDVLYFKKKTKIYETVINILVPLLCPMIMKKIADKIALNGEYEIGKAKFCKSSIKLRKHGFIRASDYLDIPPAECQVMAGDGNYIVQSTNDKAIKETVPIRSTPNAWAIPHLVESLLAADTKK